MFTIFQYFLSFCSILPESIQCNTFVFFFYLQQMHSSVRISWWMDGCNSLNEDNIFIYILELQLGLQMIHFICITEIIWLRSSISNREPQVIRVSFIQNLPPQFHFVYHLQKFRINIGTRIVFGRHLDFCCSSSSLLLLLLIKWKARSFARNTSSGISDLILPEQKLFPNGFFLQTTEEKMRRNVNMMNIADFVWVEFCFGKNKSQLRWWSVKLWREKCEQNPLRGKREEGVKVWSNRSL